MSNKKKQDEGAIIPYWAQVEYVAMERVMRRATPADVDRAMRRYLAVWAGEIGEDEAFEDLSAKAADILDVFLEGLHKSQAAFANHSRAGREARAQVGKGTGKSKKSKKAPEQDEPVQEKPEQDGPEQAGGLK